MEAVLANRCVVCDTALSGPESVLPRAFGIHRSSHNPNVCSRCKTHIGNRQMVDITTVFADLSAFTEMTHELGPERASEVVQAFLQMATETLIKYDALIDKYIGDSVMAIFNIPIQHPDHTRLAAAASLEIQSKMVKLRKRFGLDLRARIAVASGVAQVGQLGSRQFRDYTAIGDVVNLAARLEAETRAGEIILHGKVFDRAASDISGTVGEEMLTLKGFNEPVRAYRVIADVEGQQPAHYANPYLQSRKRTSSQRSFGVGSSLFSILAAPCAAGAALSPVALTLGASSAFASLQSSLLMPLDVPYVRLPMQGVAVLGMVANMYTVWRAHQVRQKSRAAGNTLSMTRAERRRIILVIGLAVVTVLAIVAEIYNHVFVEHMPLM